MERNGNSPEYWSAENTKLRKIEAELGQEHALLMPESAYRMGLRLPVEHFPDMISRAYPFPHSDQRRQALADAYKTTLGQLGNLNKERLSDDARDRYDSIECSLKALLKLMEARSYLRPFDHTQLSVPWDFLQSAQMAGRAEFSDQEHYARFEQVMQEWPAWVDEAIDHMREGIEQDYVQSRSVMDCALANFEHLLTGTHNPFLTPIENMPDHFSQAERREFTRRYQDLTESLIMPGYQRLYEFVRDEYILHCRGDQQPGLYYLPGGASEYRALTEFYAIPGINIYELHEEAKVRVDKIVDQLEQGGDLNETIRRWGQKRIESSFRTPEELIAYYTATNDEIARSLGRHITTGRLLPLKTTVVDKGPLAEGSALLFRIVGTEKQRSGRIVIPAAHPQAINRLDMARLLRHEGWPGHHLLFCLEGEPLEAARYLPYDTFEEGWAMYAEELEVLDGTLADDEEYRTARLMSELSIARGVVLESGIHGLGWSIDQALDYRRAHGGVDDALSEQQDIMRFVAWPGQCLSYFYGERHFMDYRHLAEFVLGERFDEREFHDFMLAGGPRPIAASMQRTGNWLNEKLAADIKLGQS